MIVFILGKAVTVGWGRERQHPANVKNTSGRAGTELREAD